MNSLINNKTMITPSRIHELIDLIFDEKYAMYTYHYNSYNQFINEIAFKELESNSNLIFENVTKDKIYKYKFKFSNIQLKPPVDETSNDDEILFPEDARIKFLTYSSRLLADVKQIQESVDVETNEVIEKVLFEDKMVTIAKLPIMFRSNYCSTVLRKDRSNTECNYDPGCYFIIKGSEKVIMSQERIIDNKILVFSKKDSNFADGIMYSCQVNSKKVDDLTANLQIISIKMRKDSALLLSMSQMQEIPIFIIFKALGIVSDKSIISYIVYDDADQDMINIIKFSLTHYKEESWRDDAGNINYIRSQEDAINYLITKMKIVGKRFSEINVEIRNMQKREYLLTILERDILPHMGKNLLNKGYYIGQMCNKLLNCYLKRIEQDDRDSMINKRIDTPGILLGQLFRQYYKKMLNDCTKYFRKHNSSDENPINIISQIKHTIIEQGLNSALATGTWGNSKRKGIAQMLQRSTFLQLISSLRRVITPQADTASKVDRMRFVHNTQYGFIDPIETPEHGHTVGTVKNLSNSATITINSSTQPEIIKDILKGKITNLSDVPPIKFKLLTKVLINGEWIGLAKDPVQLTELLKNKRKMGEIERYTGIAYNYNTNEIRINSDAGRMVRPLLKVTNNKLHINDHIIEEIDIKNKTDPLKIHKWNDLLMKYPNIIEYVDQDEQETALISMFIKDVETEFNKMVKVIPNANPFGDTVDRYNDTVYKRFSHCEIHPSLNFGNTSCNVPFCEYNQSPRNYYNFSQARQALGVYSSNYRHRVDLAYLLYHPARPIVATRGSRYNGLLDLPCGENCIVAIAMYTGYNQEDSIVFNQSSIERGLFRAISYRKESEEITKNPATGQDEIFAKPDRNKVAGMKDGNYDKINEKGFVPEETLVKNGDVIIGKITPITPGEGSNKIFKDASLMYKGGVDGVIDKVYTGIKNADGYEIYNMRIRQERIPRTGDKFCYTGDHEVLTTNGWINIKDITPSHQIACLKNGNTLQYENPIDIQELHWSGMLYNIKNDQVDLSVTDNHRMFVAECNSKEFKIRIAKDIYGKMLKYKKHVEYYMPTQLNNQFILNNIIFEVNIWLELFSVWITEGSCNETEVIFNANTDIINDKLIGICGHMNFKYRCTLNKFYIENKDLLNYFCDYSNPDNREFPNWIWSLNKSQCNLIIDNMLLVDGFTMIDGYTCYETTSNILADQFQRLCLHAGFSSNKGVGYMISDKKMHRLTIINSSKGIFVNNIGSVNDEHNHDDFVPYSGKVYCCTVPYDGIIYVRRNGIPVWSGNCSRSAQKGTIGKTLRAEDMPFTKDGIQPDIIINPCCLPSRMTIGQLMEAVISKSAALDGSTVEAVPFDKIDMASIHENLIKNGFEEYGNETLYCGFTGKKMESKIFICPTYYLRLRHLVQDKIHCLDEKHDVLTLEGWKPIKEITMTDKVATLENNKLVYTNPIAVLDFPDYEGNMYYINNKNIDLAVTGNHRMFVSKKDKYEFDTAENLIGKCVKYKKDVEWSNQDYKFVNDYDYNNLNLDMNSWLTFLGICYSNSRLFEDKIIIDVSKKQVKKELYIALDKLNFIYSEDTDLCNCINIFNKEVASYITDFKNNKFSKWIFELSRMQTQIFINGILLFKKSYHTRSSEIADQIQQLCLHAGWACNINSEKSYCLTIIKSKINQYVNSNYQEDKIIHIKCPVYCLQVPSEIFYVRRNGKAVWTGNSRARGPVTLLTHQPPEGRARDGGLRFGEMERDAILAHGIPLFLKEKYFDSSDGYYAHICVECGLIARKMINKNVYICDSCKTSDTNKIQFPYAFKLFIQELMAINILPRIRTIQNEFNNSI